MAVYAVGDLQGCLTPLQKLLKKVGFNTDRDRLWLTGDLINRGPESLEALRFVHDRRDNITTVLGNHDLHLLAVAEGCREPSKSDTLDQILAAKDRTTLLDWLNRQPLLHQELGYTLVHAGIPPQWSLPQAQMLADEVAAVLQSEHRREYFEQMYGNEPDIWDEELEGPERWRVITNYFTRMRFCSARGQLELKTKEGAGEAPKGFAPWFAHEERLTHNARIVFGHWAALEGKTNTPGVFALDTGCVWGNAMTLMDLEEQVFFRYDCQRGNVTVTSSP